MNIDAGIFFADTAGATELYEFLFSNSGSAIEHPVKLSGHSVILTTLSVINSADTVCE